MIVIADSSPLIVLVIIDFVDVLPSLFGRVLLPTQVAAELASERRPKTIRDFISNEPAWLRIQQPKAIEPIQNLHEGEAAAISLAKELNADFLLIDEIDGRKAALARNIKIAGTVGVLELAADRGMVDLRIAFDRIKQTDFWISSRLLDERLALHVKKTRPQK